MGETFIERLDRYKEYAGLNDNQITVKSGLTIGIINSARKRRSSLSGENIEKILNAFKDINARWLLTGEGEMLQNGVNCAPVFDRLTVYLEKENKELKTENDMLHREIGSLERQVIELKKHVHVEGHVTCATASESNLAEKII